MRKKSEAQKRRAVADLVNARKRALPEFTPDQHKQVKDALDHNEKTAGTKGRLSILTVFELLREDYSFEHSVATLEHMVRAVFQRRSWANK